MASHALREGSLEGFPTLTLASHGAGIEVAYAPSVGMVGCSLRHQGDELLDARGGLREYSRSRGTMGIPLLHPWANRLTQSQFEVAGGRVDIDAASRHVATDSNGLPIHGLLSASPAWEVISAGADSGGAHLSSRLDFAAQPELRSAFPFPHELELGLRLEHTTLTITTTLRPSGDVPVPVSFGYHPYFRLPGVARAQWHVTMPVRSHIVVDERLIPTGRSELCQIHPGPLNERTYDDAFDQLPQRPVFALEGGRRRLEVEFVSGYPIAVVWAPPEYDLICFEPMTAPTNALVTQGPELPIIAPGGSYTAVFRIAVTTTG